VVQHQDLPTERYAVGEIPDAYLRGLVSYVCMLEPERAERSWRALVA
jgi:hypothetical protein